MHNVTVLSRSLNFAKLCQTVLKTARLKRTSVMGKKVYFIFFYYDSSEQWRPAR